MLPRMYRMKILFVRIYTKKVKDVQDAVKLFQDSVPTLVELGTSEISIGALSVKMFQTEEASINAIKSLKEQTENGNDLKVLTTMKSFARETASVLDYMLNTDGRVDIDFMYINGVDGTKIPVFVGELAKQQAKSYAGAAGAAIGGMIILGPVGVIGGAFVKGSSITIPEGSVTFVQVSEDVVMQGVIYTE